MFQYVRVVPVHGGGTLPREANRDAGGRGGSDVERVPEAEERRAVHRSPVLQPLDWTHPGTQENPGRPDLQDAGTARFQSAQRELIPQFDQRVMLSLQG